ncbi:uncharacterized protein [Nicotiana tomentosiformis]|uniref:uncharacterized protein n=1 Tax=Nicotiana tomentosiformis TaxID=4098 RepID=UPI00388CC00E
MYGNSSSLVYQNLKGKIKTTRRSTPLRDEFSKQDSNNPAKEPAKEAKSLPERSSADKTNDDETARNASGLAANLKNPRKMTKMTLGALLVLGTGFYVANMMKSANEAEKWG